MKKLLFTLAFFTTLSTHSMDKLRPVSFVYKPDPSKSKNYGFIAEEIPTSKKIIETEDLIIFYVISTDSYHIVKKDKQTDKILPKNK